MFYLDSLISLLHRFVNVRNYCHELDIKLYLKKLFFSESKALLQQTIHQTQEIISDPDKSVAGRISKEEKVSQCC